MEREYRVQMHENGVAVSVYDHNGDIQGTACFDDFNKATKWVEIDYLDYTIDPWHDNR